MTSTIELKHKEPLTPLLTGSKGEDVIYGLEPQVRMNYSPDFQN